MLEYTFNCLFPILLAVSTHPVDVGNKREVRLKGTRREQFAQERVQEPLVEQVVDLAAVDALRQERHERLPRDLFRGQVGAAL